MEIFQDDDIIQVPSGTYVSLKGQVAQQMQCQTSTSMDSSYNDHTLPPELPFGTTRVDISQDIAQFEENVASLGLWQNLVRFLPGVINVLGARNLRDPPSRRTEEIAQGGRDPIMDALQIVWNDEDLNNADRIHFFRPKFRHQNFDVETSYSWQERNAISISDVLADVWPDLDRIAFQIERIIHEESVYCADDDAVFMILEPRAPWWPHGWHAALVEKTQVLGDFIHTMMVPIMLPKRTSQLELCVLMFGPERGAFCEVRRYGAALQPDQVCWNYVGTLVHLIQRHEETALIRPPHNPNWNFGTIFAVGLPFFTETPDLRIVAILKREFRDMQTMEIFRPPTRFVSQSMVVTLQAWYTWGVIDGKLKARWPELQDSSWVRPAVDETWKESHQLRHRQHVHVLIEPAFVTNNVVVLLAMTDEEEEWVKAVFMIGRLTVHDLLRDYGKLSKCQQEGQSCIVRHNGDWKNMDDPMVLRHRDMIQIFIAATEEAEVCLPARKMPRKLQVAMASDSSSAGTTLLQIKAVKSDTSFARHAWNRLPRPGNGNRKVHFDDVIQQRCFNSRTIVEQRFVQDNAVSNDYVLQLTHEKKQGASWQSFVNDVRFEHLKDNPPFLWTPEGCKDEQQAKAMLPQLSDDYVVRPAPTSIGKNHWCLMDRTSQVLPIFLCGQEVQLCYVAKYSKLQEMELVFHCRLKGENDRQIVLFPGQVFFVIEESQCTPSPKHKRLWKEYSDTKQKENDQGYDSPAEANSHSKPIGQGRSRVTEELCCQLFPPVADRTIESEEVLLLDLNVNDEQEKKSVPVINQVRRDRPFVEDLPDELAAAVMSVPDWLGNEQGTIHVFTDGSYLRDTDVAGWAAIILMEGTSDVPFSYVGYIAGRQEAHSQEAGEAGAYVAELLGIGNAAEIINASSSRCHFHVDSTSAADVAFGRAAIGSFASLASAVRHRVMVLESRMEVSVSHVKGHSGHPWNEAVDRLAGAVRTGMLEPTNHILFDPTKQNEWAWALHESGESNDMPVQQNGMFLVEAPPLQPVLDFCLPTLSRATEETVELKARFVTYNACSVHVPGRRQFLSKQFDQEQICAVGIQESQDRSQNDFGFDHWQVFRSAADKHGNFGCELWLHIKKTIVQGKGQKHGWDVQSAIVKVREPRLLIVTIAAGKVPFALIVLHAPSNHLGEEVQEKWWAQTTKSVKRAVPHSHHVIVLADANAQLLRPGDLGSCRGHYNVSSPAEELFFDWLQTENLVVRTREDDEGRSLFTWSHSSATDVDEVQKGSCLDYIATSSDLASCGTSIDLSGFDTGREKIDHLPVGIEFKTWIGTSFQNMPKRKPRVDVDIINTPAGEAICKQIALSIPKIPWEIDATSHAQILEEHVSEAMLQYFPKPKRQPKKPFLDQEAIQLVRQRRLTQRWLKQLKAFRRLCQTWFFFQAWKYHKCEDRSLPDFRSWNSEGGRCQGQLELFARDLMRKYQNVAKHKLRAYVSDSVTVASQEGLDHLFQRLRKLTKSRKHKTKFSLPALQKPDGAVANTPLQVYEIWEKHFQESERGQFVDSMALQHEHQEKAFKRFVETAQSNEVLTSADVPTLQECEQALLKFARKRAPGLSGIPIDLLRNAAPDFARKAYPLVLKSVLRFEEPLQWQGSLIAPIPKSNGISPHAKDWRQISLQEGLAKMTHRAYREKLMPYFESFASPLQGGARRGMPTSLPAQAVRLFQGACHQRKISSMVIFLDAKQAYYQIARDVLWFRQWPPDRQRDFLDRMPCSEHMKQQIGEVFSARCPLEQCSVPSKIGNIIQSLFEDVWTTMGVNGMPSCSMTGTRPGDPLADLLWSIAFGSVIRQLKSDFTELDLVVQLDSRRFTCLPIWADDLCVLVSHSDPFRLIELASIACNRLSRAFASLAVELNLGKGKTEIIFSFHGLNATKAKRQVAIDMGNQIPFQDFEGTNRFVRIATTYKHLGGLVGRAHQFRTEVRSRAGIAGSAFRALRKHVFANRTISREVKLHIYDAIVRSKFYHHASCWSFSTQQEWQVFDTAAFRLLRSLAVVLHGHEWKEASNEKIVARLGVLHPRQLLRIERLRQFQKICQFADADFWAILEGESNWLHNMLYSDLLWLKENRLCPDWLCIPEASQVQGLATLLADKGAEWKTHLKQVGKACRHHAQRLQEAHEFECKALQMLRQIGVISFEQTHGNMQKAVKGSFRCQVCDKIFGTLKALGVHKHRQHEVFSAQYYYAKGDTCPVCLKYYGNSEALQQHWQYKRGTCWSIIQESDLDPEDFGGDRIARELEIPPLAGMQCAGPKAWWSTLRPLVQDNSSGVENTEAFEEAAIHYLLSLAPVEEELHSFLDGVKSAASFLLRTFGQEYLKQEGAIRMASKTIALCSPEHRRYFGRVWDVLKGLWQQIAVPTESLDWNGLICGNIAFVVDCNFRALSLDCVPKQRAKYVLHLFSGRRREADIQYWIEELARQTGCSVTCLSFDLAIDEKCDLLDAHAQSWLRQMIKAGRILALIAGPPCETWSRARGVCLKDESSASQPRVLRSSQEPWGMIGLSQREHTQCIVGSRLLQFTIILVLDCIQAATGCLLEHPDEPEDDASLASIWRLKVLRAMLALLPMRKLRVWQGQFGAKSPKPTALMVYGLRTLEERLEQQRSSEMPATRSIGRTAEGIFATSELKEYPPRMRLSIARAVVDSFKEASAGSLDPEEIELGDDAFLQAAQSPWDPYLPTVMHSDFGSRR